MSKVVTARCALLVWLFAGAIGCGSKPAAEASATPPPGPGLGLLELPVALRSRDALPSGYRKVEVGLSDLRVDDHVLLTLEAGKVPAAERQGDLVPKLKAALSSPASPGVALRMHSGLSYETGALVLNTASSVGMKKLAIEVRSPGNTSSSGWLLASSFQTTPRSDDEVAIEGVVPHKWDDFAANWQTMNTSCSRSPTGSCAYVESNVAKGGNLKIVLHASGQGVNLDFHRVGVSAAELATEAAARQAAEAAKQAELEKAQKKKKKGKTAPTQPAADAVEGEPATDALFQFRAPDAVKEPSVMSEVMKPLCGPNACAAVVSADSNTLMVRVISLIGAAFPDGAAAPALAFELPWTDKPKSPPPAAPGSAAPVAPTPAK